MNQLRTHSSYHYTKLLQSCNTFRALQQIHAQIITTLSSNQQDTILATKLISQYSQLHGISSLPFARRIFDGIKNKDVFLWNVMIRCYATFGHSSQATTLYDQMVQIGTRPNCHTYTFVLKACSSPAANTGGDFGRRKNAIHSRIFKCGLDSNLYVSNSLLSFYAKLGDLISARKLFDKITDKDLVTWNSMITSYRPGQSTDAQLHEALILFHRMLQSDTIYPDHFTFISILPICSKLSSIKEGLWIHTQIIKSIIPASHTIAGGLITMYATCGRLQTARILFNSIHHKNLIVWDAMMRAYGIHGHASQAFQLLTQMIETGISPDAICFTSVLSACSHSGMVEQGEKVFDMMDKHDVEKNEVHYACMVDLMGRAGKLQDAVEFISNMPSNVLMSGKDVWGALLGGCRIHGNLELAEEVAEKLFCVDPGNAGRYAVLARMYEDAGRWEDEARVRLLMRERGVRKPLGYSAIEVKRLVCVFGVEDESYLLSEEIYQTLDLLRLGSFSDEGGEEKETEMCLHLYMC
ncbi:Pentatricopeptide repeat-containing protein [Zostera marina]|uniref:Pentatricopeptide repeat-containing protein n=1 Tax=Zostera marina TaxID=29655 RepID=A0A0K9PBD3_ZOSMR|nr:Pentatricopeptide repeat-containing protein [Zostera marina]